MFSLNKGIQLSLGRTQLAGGEQHLALVGAAQKSGKGFWPLYPSVLPAVLQVEPGPQNSRSLAMLDPLPPKGGVTEESESGDVHLILRAISLPPALGCWDSLHVHIFNVYICPPTPSRTLPNKMTVA